MEKERGVRGRGGGGGGGGSLAHTHLDRFETRNLCNILCLSMMLWTE